MIVFRRSFQYYDMVDPSGETLPGEEFELETHEDVMSALEYLVLFGLEQTVLIQSLDIDGIQLVFHARRRMELLTILDYPHLLLPLVLVTRQYLLLHQLIGDEMAQKSMQLLMSKESLISRIEQIGRMPKPVKLDVAVWGDRLVRQSVQLSLVLGLLPETTVEEFDELVEETDLEGLIEYCLETFEAGVHDLNERRINPMRRTN